MKRFTLLFILFITGSIFLNAQNNSSLNSAEILQAFKKLNTVGSVLYIAAHPDDENTRLLAYLSKEKNLRTGYLSLTRGDGGQNLVGKEQGDVLGLIRTQELLAARRIDGAEQFFTRANDFGFSKNPEETFTIWNKDSVLADAVWCIRRFKPDVIICRFPTTGEGGHGHHTASALLAVEAFEAAADPKRFPQQLAYTEVWQAKRIFWNTFNFGTTNTTAPDQLKIDVGGFNPLLGKGYGEIAAESRSMHKSQGFGSAKGRGASVEYFKQLKGEPVKEDLFEGIDQSWKRLAAAAKFQGLVNECIKTYDAQKPESSVPALVSIYKQLQQLDEKEPNTRYWKQQKLKEVESLLLACTGLWLEATAAEYIGIPGNSVDITAQVIGRNNSPVKLNKISWLGQTDTATALILKQNELYSFKHKETLPVTASFSNPYWLNEKHTAGQFVVKDQLLIGQPENTVSTKVIFDLELPGLKLQCERGLVYKYTDPVKGEIYRPFEILPPATVNLAEKVYVFSGKTPKKVEFIIKANAPDISGLLTVNVPDGWTIVMGQQFRLVNKGDEVTLEGTITPGNRNGGTLNASLIINEKTYSKSIMRVEYDHIPYQFILSRAEVGSISISLEKAGTAIGYIAGAGDEVPACLKQLGYTVTMLTDEMLSNEDLSKYNAIVTGVRAYNTNDRLQAHHDKLMEYVHNGGNLVVQYNTNSKVGPLLTKIGPYPFTISRDRVTDESAEVRIINPAHSVLNYPNKISAADFEGWKQERGIYFATELNENYEKVLSMNDPGEKPHEGSLIVSKYGKGNFVYTGLAFFRELPAGVPGAYRLFVNLLSIPAQK
ncbi:MAG: PIG-L family deacetylase [Bacteroidota bacterium]